MHSERLRTPATSDGPNPAPCCPITCLANAAAGAPLASPSATATYHDSCSGLRELGILQRPRALLSEVEGLRMTPLAGNDVCCDVHRRRCATPIGTKILSKKRAKPRPV